MDFFCFKKNKVSVFCFFILALLVTGESYASGPAWKGIEKDVDPRRNEFVNPFTGKAHPLKKPFLTFQEAVDIIYEFNNTPTLAFNNTVDGCSDRAHIMAYRLEKNLGIQTEKIWLKRGKEGLFIPIPTGRTDIAWDFHVAPLVKVQLSTGEIQKKVLDPALADHPISPEIWAEKMRARPEFFPLRKSFAEQSVTITSGTHTHTSKYLFPSYFEKESILAARAVNSSRWREKHKSNGTYKASVIDIEAQGETKAQAETKSKSTDVPHLVCEGGDENISYKVLFSANYLSAEVFEETYVDTGKVADLACHLVRHSAADRECQQGSGKGYKVTLRMNSATGKPSAILLSGETPLASLNCRPAK